MSIPSVEDRYLGDGVYASFDGYQIWLAVDDATNKLVAIEPSVFNALTDYVGYIREALKAAADAALQEANNNPGEPQ